MYLGTSLMTLFGISAMYKYKENNIPFLSAQEAPILIVQAFVVAFEYIADLHSLFLTVRQ